MMRFFKLAPVYIPIIMLLSFLQACGLRVINGSGTIKTDARTVSGFDAIDFSGSGELVITQGDTESLTIEADDNILPHVLTEVRNGVLEIKFDRDDWGTYFRPTKPIRFNLALKDLRSVSISGSGDFSASTLKAESLSFDISGSGKVRIEDLDASELVFEVSGSGEADLIGKVVSQKIDISGSGSYRAGDLESQTADIHSSGSANVTLWVTESLAVDTSGSGSVSYFGSPKVTSSSSGSSSLTGLGDKQ